MGALHLADLRGRKSRERLVHHIATPETIRKLDNVTIDRLYASGYLRAEHVDAWLEIHDAWKALSRGLGLRLMRFSEPSDRTTVELSARLEKLISKHGRWREELLRLDKHDCGEIVIATIEGHALKDMTCGVLGGIDTIKAMLRDGLHEYCKMDGTI